MRHVNNYHFEIVEKDSLLATVGSIDTGNKEKETGRKGKESNRNTQIDSDNEAKSSDDKDESEKDVGPGYMGRN